MALHCVRETGPALLIAQLPKNCRYFSIKVGAARKRFANPARVNLPPHSPLNRLRAGNARQNKLVRPAMSLDTSTLYLVATLVAALLGVMLLFFGRQERIA